MKRKSYTVKEKLLALKKLEENGNNISVTARLLGVTNKMIREWKAIESKLLIATNKPNARHIGSGRMPLYPNLELILAEWIKIQRIKHKRIIDYRALREKALSIALSENINNFVASNGWIELFLKRNNFACRKITSIGQEDRRDKEIIRNEVVEYFDALSLLLNNKLNSECIVNMDETPVYIDMLGTQTISFKGEKNTEVHTTGHQKTRLTVVLAINLKGEFLKTMVILKGLKKVPKCKVPRNLFIATSSTGMMDNRLMKQWIDVCYNTTGPFKSVEEKLLILDSFAAHKENSVINHLLVNNSKHIFLPPKTTSFLQPLDVLVNSSFKARMKKFWGDWFINGEKEYTKNNYRKKPSWENIFEWVSQSVKSLNSALVMKSYEMCGIGSDSVCLEREKLNQKLQKILYLEAKDSIADSMDDELEIVSISSDGDEIN